MSSRVLSRRGLSYIFALVTTSAAVLYTTSRIQKLSVPEQQNYALQKDKHGAFVLPKFPHIKSREEQIAHLRRHDNQPSSTSSSVTEDVYDLIVIGGGATGSGIALDAVTRGLKVALVERDDFSSGTSSRSTKLVHGGVRYLEKAVRNLDYGQLLLVREALRERINFLDIAPHLCCWIPVMVPLQHFWQAPYLWAGMKCYDLLAGSQSNPSSYFLSKRGAIEAFPLLTRNLVGALVYYDGQQNDSRMNVSLVLTAALYGATTVNHLEVTRLEKDEGGRLYGAHVRDLIAEEDTNSGKSGEFFVRAKGIINATGPFSDSIRKMDEGGLEAIIEPSSGVHVSLPAHFTPQNMGLLDPSTSDGRMLFVVPWQNTSIAGTTDAPCKVSRDPQATEQDIDWILNAVRKYFSPDVSLERRDVLAAWSGIRPLVRDSEAKNTESLMRSHLVGVSESGLLTCAGGKWTTYRQMAEDAVDKAIEVFGLKAKRLEIIPNISGLANVSGDQKFDGACQTQGLRLIGAHGYSSTLHINLIQHFGLEPDIATHLAQSYGDRAWEVAALASFNVNARLSPQYPLTEAEVQYALQFEYARTAVDVLARRTRLSFTDAQAALEALPTVIDLMSEPLQWNEKKKELEWRHTVHFLGTMGLPANMMGITRDELLQRKLGQDFVPRKGRRRLNLDSEEAVVTDPALPAIDGEVVH